VLEREHDDAEYAQALFRSGDEKCLQRRSSESDFGVVSGGYEGVIYSVGIYTHVSARPTKSEPTLRTELDQLSSTL
jgi:hypothetical protein